MHMLFMRKIIQTTPQQLAPIWLFPCFDLQYHQPEKVQASGSVPKKQLVEAFAGVERDAVDMQIMLFLCANGIPFNVLRSPQYYEMVAAIQRAPKGYKPPAYEKARTTLLDACKRKVENDLAPVRQTW